MSTPSRWAAAPADPQCSVAPPAAQRAHAGTTPPDAHGLPAVAPPPPLACGLQAVYVPLQISLHDPATPSSAAARFASALRPVASMSKVRAAQLAACLPFPACPLTLIGPCDCLVAGILPKANHFRPNATTCRVPAMCWPSWQLSQHRRWQGRALRLTQRA